jgi:hypothetical protein
MEILGVPDDPGIVGLGLGVDAALDKAILDVGVELGLDFELAVGLELGPGVEVLVTVPDPVTGTVGIVESDTVSPAVALQSVGPKVVVPPRVSSNAVQDESVTQAVSLSQTQQTAFGGRCFPLKQHDEPSSGTQYPMWQQAQPGSQLYRDGQTLFTPTAQLSGMLVSTRSFLLEREDGETHQGTVCPCPQRNHCASTSGRDKSMKLRILWRSRS